MRTLYVIGMVVVVFSCHQTDLIRIEESDPEGVVRNIYFIDQDSIKQGPWLSFYENGVDTFEWAHYHNDQIHGQRILYYPNGTPEIIENYEEGVLSGPVTTYNEDGTLAFESVYSNGVLNGLVVSYFQGGSKKEEVSFKDNLENGPFIEYHPNGNKSWEGSYLNGENEFGLLSQYDSSGVLIKKMMCDSQAICRTIWTLEKGDIDVKI